MKYWKPIVSILALVLVAVLIVGVFLHFSVPRLPQKEKEKVEQAFVDQQMGRINEIIWYDENDHIEEDGVLRYIGTYGDCYAFLQIGDGMGATMWPLELPKKLDGLAREVYYPNDADVMLYHTKQVFTYAEVFNSDVSSDETLRLQYLSSIENIQDWLTDKQLEKLTRDVEKIAKEHN